MARIRSVKPEFWDDRKLAKRTTRDARLLYIALWNLADEHARLNGDPQWIKGQVFSYDDDLDAAGVTKLLGELIIPSVGAVIPYEVDGDPYLFLPKLAKHQRLEPEKVKSRIPAPPEIRADLAGSGADSSARRADRITPGASSSGSGAGSSTLLYVAGSMEHVGREQGAGDARDTNPRTADRLLTEHLDLLPNRPGKDLVRDTGDMIDRLLAEKIPQDVLREALARWRMKPKYGISLLPRLAQDITGERAAASGTSRAPPRGHKPFQNPPDQSVYDEELAP